MVGWKTRLEVLVVQGGDGCDLGVPSGTQLTMVRLAAQLTVYSQLCDHHGSCTTSDPPFRSSVFFRGSLRTTSSLLGNGDNACALARKKGTRLKVTEVPEDRTIDLGRPATGASGQRHTVDFGRPATGASVKG